MLPTSLPSRGWALYLFFWEEDRYPFDFDKDANPDSFVRVATFAWPYTKTDGSEAFAEERPIFARKNFEIGDHSERGFVGREDWFSIPTAYRLTVLRPDRVRVGPTISLCDCDHPCVRIYPIQDQDLAQAPR